MNTLEELTRFLAFLREMHDAAIKHAACPPRGSTRMDNASARLALAGLPACIAEVEGEIAARADGVTRPKFTLTAQSHQTVRLLTLGVE